MCEEPKIAKLMTENGNAKVLKLCEGIGKCSVNTIIKIKGRFEARKKSKDEARALPFISGKA